MDKGHKIPASFALRSIFLPVLLTALVVSSGEGLRVFPIPVSDISNENSDAQSLSRFARDSYTLTVHRFYSHGKTLKSKASKRAATVDSAAQSLLTNLAAERPAISIASTSQTTFSPAGEAHTSPPSDRAPPVS